MIPRSIKTEVLGVLFLFPFVTGSRLKVQKGRICDVKFVPFRMCLYLWGHNAKTLPKHGDRRTSPDTRKSYFLSWKDERTCGQKNLTNVTH